MSATIGNFIGHRSSCNVMGLADVSGLPTEFGPLIGSCQVWENLPRECSMPVERDDLSQWRSFFLSFPFSFPASPPNDALFANFKRVLRLIRDFLLHHFLVHHFPPFLFFLRNNSFIHSIAFQSFSVFEKSFTNRNGIGGEKFKILASLLLFNYRLSLLFPPFLSFFLFRFIVVDDAHQCETLRRRCIFVA